MARMTAKTANQAHRGTSMTTSALAHASLGGLPHRQRGRRTGPGTAGRTDGDVELGVLPSDDPVFTKESSYVNPMCRSSRPPSTNGELAYHAAGERRAMDLPVQSRARAGVARAG